MSILQTLAGSVLEITLAVSVVIAALLLLRPLLGRRYRARLYWWAWLLIAIRLVIPLNVSLPETPVRIPVPDQTVLYQRVDSPPALPAQSAVSPEGTAGSTEGAAAPVTVPDDVQSPRPAAYESSLTLPQALSLLWAAGGGVFLMINLALYARFRRKIRRWRRAEDDPAARAQFEALCGELSVKGLTLARCGAITSPLVTGFFRPVLLLPERTYSAGELDAVLRHELTHARRGDLWYKLLLLLARSVHWFNPLVHLMVHRAGRDLEISCDESVVAGRDAQFQAQYGQAVLSAAEHGLCQRAPLTSYFHSGKKTLLERLRTIVGKSGQKRGIALICVVAVLAATVAAACSVTGTPDGGYSGPARWELDGYTVELAQDSEGVFTFSTVWENEDGATALVYLQQLPEEYGSLEEYPYNVDVRTFADVLGHSGIVLSYGVSELSRPVEYYCFPDAEHPRTHQLLLACNGTVYELDVDGDGTAEVLELPAGTDGDARLYRRMGTEADPSDVGVADLNLAAAIALGFTRGGVGVEYVEPEGGYTPGQPMQFRCFTRGIDAGTLAGEAVDAHTLVSVAWDDLTYQWPIEGFENTTESLWPDYPNGMSRDAGTLWWNDTEGNAYGVSFSLNIPADAAVQELGTGCHEYWTAVREGGVQLMDSLPEGVTYEGNGMYAELRKDSNVSWYYLLSDGVHCLELQWSAADMETARAVRDSLVISGDGPIQRTYYKYERPTADMFGLTGEYAAMFNCLVDEFWTQHPDTNTLYLPRITCYGTYEAAGRVVYVCRVQEDYYYELTLENRSVMPGAGSTFMCFHMGGSDAGTPVVDLWAHAQDGGGWGSSIRDLCGPLTGLADYLMGVEGAETFTPVWDELPSGADMLRQYVARTGAPIDTVAIYGTDMVPLADYRDGW